MANVVVPNFVRDATNAPDLWCVTWRAILALLHAGWRPAVFSDGVSAVASGMTSVASLPTNWLSSLTNVNAGGTGPSVTTKAYSGQMTITGVSGLVSPTSSSRGSEGNYLTFTGFASAGNNGTFQIIEVLSATSCVIQNTGGVASDANNGLVGVAWQEKGFDSASYVPASWTSRAPWCVLKGPRIIKVPVTSAISANFRVGEMLSQGAGSTERRGELLGYVINAAGNSGWVVVDPCDYGTWDTSTVTGVLSAATFTPSSTPLIYEQEVVFGKNSANYTSAAAYVGCFETVGEAADSFSSRGASAAIGVTVGLATNTFPTHAYVVQGEGSLLVAPGLQRAYGSNTSTDWGSRAQIMCANAIPRTSVAGEGRPADGSFTVITHVGPAVSTDGGIVYSFQRLDGCEPGDVSPFANLGTASASTSAYERRTRSNNSNQLAGSSFWSSSSSTFWQAFCVRGSGITARDLAQPYYAVTENLASVYMLMSNSGEVMRVLNHPDTTAPYLRFRVALYFDGPGINAAADVFNPSAALLKHRKGYPRWVMCAGAGARISTFDTLKWVTLCDATASLPAVAFGPYDGVTTPLA